MSELRNYIFCKTYTIEPEDWMYELPKTMEELFDDNPNLTPMSIEGRLKFLHDFIDREICNYVKGLNNVDGARIVDLMEERDFILTCIRDRVKSEFIKTYFEEYDNKIITFNDLLILVIR